MALPQQPMTAKRGMVSCYIMGQKLGGSAHELGAINLTPSRGYQVDSGTLQIGQPGDYPTEPLFRRDSCCPDSHGSRIVQALRFVSQH